MKLPQLEDLPSPSGKRVLVRADFNVPIKDGVIQDDMRIRAALPTLTWLQEQGATVTACTHLGRPKGVADPKYSVEPVRKALAELAPGVALLENLRFDPGEETDDHAFVDRLCEGQDLYVNDAFGSSHRAHASIVGPPARLPSAAGRLLAQEVDILDRMLHDHRKPFVAVLGGAKVSDKLGVIHTLLEKIERLIVGGAMAFTFLLAEGHDVGDSLVEHDWVERCRALLDEAGGRIVLPEDITAVGPNEEVRQAGVDLRAGWKGLDIGPGSAAAFSDVIADARTLFWNGPMGVFEDPRFEAGTRTIAQAVADCRGFTIVGGGDSASALKQFGLEGEVDHVSTGGGASLEFIELGDLPGLEALRKASNAPG